MSASKIQIVTTIGPATSSEKMMTGLVRKGATHFRLNMSHGDHSTHGQTVSLSRAVAQKTKKHIELICDVCGPKIRIGDFAEKTITLVRGKPFLLTTRAITGNENEVFINLSTLPNDVKEGDMIYLDDGKKSLQVKKVVNSTDVLTTVVTGGVIAGRRGVNAPTANLSVQAITAKDKKDIAWGVSLGIQYFAVSFVRSAKDIRQMRSILKKLGSDAKVIAKVETPQALENIDEIIAESDAVMVARGDLAIEIGAQYVPSAQKMIIKKCNDAGKMVITATQMLESMTRSPVPTRAEVSDVYNAVLDGTDALMLSEETAMGEYPLLAVNMMSLTAKEAKKNLSL